MKKLGLMLLLCGALVVGCKTRNSHVQKSTLDSSIVKREQSNLDIVAGSAKVTNTSLTLDSNWINAIRLTNFSGQILFAPTGTSFEGSADQAEVQQSGSAQKQQTQTATESDSLQVSAQDETREDVTVTKKEYDRQKEVKGIAVPWWVWAIGIVAIILFGYWVVMRIKTSLNPIKNTFKR